MSKRRRRGAGFERSLLFAKGLNDGEKLDVGGRGEGVARARAAAMSLLDPRPYLHLVRLVHYYNYSHVTPRRRMATGEGVRIAPNVSLRNGERIRIGDGAHVGERCALWAGAHTGRIDISSFALLGPNVFITASNYRFQDGRLPVMSLRRSEANVHIGSNTWLGAGVIILPGVTVGEGAIVAAGAVVTRSVPPWSIVAGVPAREVGVRCGDEAKAESRTQDELDLN